MGAEMTHEPKQEYCISFKTNTKEVKEGFIKVLKVVVFEDVGDINETLRVDLADSPFYKELQRYVLANPR